MNSDIRTSLTILRKRDPQHNLAQFYALSVQPNLFGSWFLSREWGRIGQGGRVKIELCDPLEEAVTAFYVKLRQKQRRGYI
jgi:predicted DNA-binding WGR domain protein